ncbi:MAG: PEP-CTERM sorting domain-containing protein [Kiritimatiellae bacterium]|nr:PEP-CTERM sorting domain-containing protein [Kiritimatiellia bacterium]
MKKIMFALAVAVIAGFAQAAQVKWSSGTVANGFADENGDSLANSTAYTLTVMLWDATGTTKLDEMSATTANATGAYSGTFSYTAAASTDYMISAVLAKNDGTATLEMDKAAFTTAASGTKTLNITTGANFASTGSKWDSGGWQTSGGGVPEPTSGLLLLVGGAMLALRRKQK